MPETLPPEAVEAAARAICKANNFEWLPEDAWYWTMQADAALSAALPLLTVKPDQDTIAPSYIDVLFDGPPGHKSGQFVEVENPEGRSVNAGDWIERDDGLWALRISRPGRTEAQIKAEAWDEGFHAAIGAVPDDVWFTAWGDVANPHRIERGEEP